MRSAKEARAPHPLRRAQHGEYGVGIEHVVAVAPFHPEPVSKCDESAQTQCRQECDGVGRREEQKVGGQGDGGHGVEGQVREEAHWRRPVGQDQFGVDLVVCEPCCPTPVQILPQCLTARRPQYSRLIRHSIGALATLSAFLTANRLRLRVRSANRPTAVVSVAMDKPMIVRYWRCHPYDSFLYRGRSVSAAESRRTSGQRTPGSDSGTGS
jgi:hypothetical protein